jgi:hypothetical protein
LEFISKTKKANKSFNATIVIELEMELERLQLKGMRGFYNDMVRVMDKYEVTKTNHELCMLMAHKNQDGAYARPILEEIKSSSPNFKRLCNNVSKIQRLTQGGNKGMGMRRRSISLP